MFTLSKPAADEPIPPGLLAYVGQKLRNDLYHVVLVAFKESNLTQADLAERMGMDKGLLSRHLSGPSNWTADTAAKILFAINGHIIQPKLVDVDALTPANMTRPSWYFIAQHNELLNKVPPPKVNTVQTGTTYGFINFSYPGPTGTSHGKT